MLEAARLRSAHVDVKTYLQLRRNARLGGMAGLGLGLGLGLAADQVDVEANLQLGWHAALGAYVSVRVSLQLGGYATLHRSTAVRC
jgi:hypothetical protein